MSASDVAAAIVHRSFFLRESKEEEKQARPEAGVTAGGDSMPAGQGSGRGADAPEAQDRQARPDAPEVDGGAVLGRSSGSTPRVQENTPRVQDDTPRAQAEGGAVTGRSSGKRGAGVAASTLGAIPLALAAPPAAGPHGRSHEQLELGFCQWMRAVTWAQVNVPNGVGSTLNPGPQGVGISVHISVCNLLSMRISVRISVRISARISVRISVRIETCGRMRAGEHARSSGAASTGAGGAGGAGGCRC